MKSDGLHEALAGKLLVSILAGVTIAQLEEWVPSNTRVLRAMPNTPTKVRIRACAFCNQHAEAQIREGMTVISSLPESQGDFASVDQQRVETIFRSIGRCRFLEEKHFDACTALSASGPAFACIFMEAMADGGVMMGLPKSEALELAAQGRRQLVIVHVLNVNSALQGAARMALQGAHPAQLKDAVTSTATASLSVYA